jgi:hypothetical protein
MELDVRVAGKSLSIPIDDPFHLDIDATVKRIESFFSEQDAPANGLDIRGLVPKLVKGIAGCEGGCPANAKSFVSRGFKNFSLAYVEGGILEAHAVAENGKDVSLKMFPDF